MTKLMNDEALAALDKSIRKWHRIWKRDGVDKGQANCALCQVYIEDICRGCPVGDKTGAIYCDKTPYTLWEQHHLQIHRDTGLGGGVRRVPGCPDCKKIAKQEHDFLVRLREDDDKERARLAARAAEAAQ